MIDQTGESCYWCGRGTYGGGTKHPAGETLLCGECGRLVERWTDKATLVEEVRQAALNLPVDQFETPLREYSLQSYSAKRLGEMSVGRLQSMLRRIFELSRGIT